MIRHILKIISNERAHNTGIVLELFIVAAALWVMVDYAFTVTSRYMEPLNFDTENTYLMRLGYLNEGSPAYSAEAENEDYGESVFKALERIQHSPMIEAASISIQASPHIGSNSSFTLYRDTLQTNYTVLRRLVTPEFFRVFQYRSLNGSTDELINALSRGEYIISESVEKKMFPGESGKGKTFSTSTGEDAEQRRIGAISTDIRYDNFSNWKTYFGSALTVKTLNSYSIGFINALEVCVRVKPEEYHDFIGRFREQMSDQLRIGNLYLGNIQSIPENKKAFQLDNKNELNMRYFIIFFLLVNIFLGISGTFWFRTQYRREEIGLRIAMGDTPSGILRMFYTEGILLLTIAVIPAMMLFLFIKKANILYASWDFGAVRYFIGLAVTYLLLLGMILPGILFPARKAIKVQPAEALRDEG